MSKLIGALLILACCGLAGGWAAGTLRQRVRFWAGAAQGAAALSREIGYGAAGLPDALAAAGENAGPAGDLFRRAGDLLRLGDGLTGPEAWRQAAAAETWAKENDRELLLFPGNGLGLSDSETQLRQLAQWQQRLQAAEAQAAAEKRPV